MHVHFSLTTLILTKWQKTLEPGWGDSNECINSAQPASGGAGTVELAVDSQKRLTVDLSTMDEKLCNTE